MGQPRFELGSMAPKATRIDLATLLPLLFENNLGYIDKKLTYKIAVIPKQNDEGPIFGIP